MVLSKRRKGEGGKCIPAAKTTAANANTPEQYLAIAKAPRPSCNVRRGGSISGRRPKCKVVSSGGGASSTLFQKVGVPKIPQQVLSSVFYLYETKADADAGRDPGGTGFILGWTHELPAVPVHYYAVTNWHVAVKEPAPDERPQCPVIRLNTKYGTTQAIDLKPENWHHIQGGIDIAVTPIEFDVRHMDWSFVPSDMVAWELDIENGLVGVGDDVFMVGLFVDHDGEAVNVPSSRFWKY